MQRRRLSSPIVAGGWTRDRSCLYFVDGNTITTVPDLSGPVGTCPESDLQNTLTLSFAFGFVIDAPDATWTVDGDTLSITGTVVTPTTEQVVTLTFDRVTA